MLVAVDRSALTTQSVEYDALVVAGGTSADAVAKDPYAAENLGEAFRHHKTIAAWGEGTAVLDLLSMTDSAGGGDGQEGRHRLRQDVHRSHGLAPALGAVPGLTLAGLPLVSPEAVVVEV